MLGEAVEMLKKLRNKKTAKKIWIILAILILPAFILWGSGSIIRNNKQEIRFAGQIAGKKIPISELRDSLAAVRSQVIMQLGDKFSEIEKNIHLESQAWERLILLKEAKKRKIIISDKEVIAAIEKYPFFQKEGIFDNYIYTQMLNFVFHTQPRKFEEQVRQSLILSELYKRVTEGIKVSEQEIKEEYQKLNESISFYYIASMPPDFAKEIAPQDEELKDYFTKNSLQFKMPLSYNLEYISIGISDKDNEENCKLKVKEIAKRLNKEKNLSETAKDFGLTVKESGLFPETGPIPGIGWSPEILNLLPKAKPGEYLTPQQIDKTYYVLQLKERKDTYIPELEKIKDKVKEMVIKDKAKKIAKEKIELCLKKIKDTYPVNPPDLDKIAQEYGLKYSTTDLFKYGSYIEGIGASDIFWNSAKGLKENELTGIIEMPSGFYIGKLKSRIPIDEKKFETEKTEVSDKLLLRKKQEFFEKFLEELKNKTQSVFKYSS